MQENFRSWTLLQKQRQLKALRNYAWTTQENLKRKINEKLISKKIDTNVIEESAPRVYSLKPGGYGAVRNMAHTLAQNNLHYKWKRNKIQKKSHGPLGALTQNLPVISKVLIFSIFQQTLKSQSDPVSPLVSIIELQEIQL